jgi:hypothetical protein
MLDIGLVNLPAFTPQLLDRFPHIDRIPDHHRIRHQIQAGGLIELIVGMAFADLRFIGHEEKPAERVQRLALIQLPVDLTPELLTAQIAKNYVELNLSTVS